MKKIKKLLTIGLAVLIGFCMGISFSFCKKEEIFIGSEDFSNPTALEQSNEEVVFDGNITISQSKKYFEVYFSSAYQYSILFDGHPFSYKIYARRNSTYDMTTPIIDTRSGVILPFPLASNSYLLEIEGYEMMAELTVNMTIKRYLK